MYGNPIRYTDPSGHACVEGTSYCVNSRTGQTSGSPTSYNDSSTLSARLDGKVEVSSNNVSSNETANTDGICSSDHPSVVCRDPNSLGEGIVWSEPSYPTRIPPQSWEPASADLTGHPLVSGILLLADLWGAYHYSDLPFQTSNQFLFGGADYKVIEISPGLKVKVPTSIKIGNNTDSEFMISSMFTDYNEIIPENRMINKREGVVFNLPTDVYLVGDMIYINLSNKDLKAQITIDLYPND